jgi:hypothetical protein
MTLQLSQRTSITVLSATLLLLFAGLFPHAALAQEDKPGSTSLFITYRCKAADRPAFLRGLESEGVKRFDELKHAGTIADYLLLFNQFVDANTWDAMIIVTFDRYVQSDGWRKLERESPGGLTANLLKLATPHTSYMADLTIRNGTPGDRSKSIFMAIPYQYRNKAEYVNYIKLYGVPQFDGWIKEGAISSYGIFLNQNATGVPWDVMLLFEYNGIEGLANRDIVKQKVRAELAKNPSWKMIQDSKQEFRTELEVVMASPVQGVKL